MNGIADVIEILERADRQGAYTDEPEGSRYIVISETLAQRMLAGLKSCVAPVAEEPIVSEPAAEPDATTEVR